MSLKLLPYLISRCLTVVYKPLILYIFSAISIDLSNLVGLVFLNTTISMLSIQSETHRYFYKIHFNQNNAIPTQKSYTQYIGLITLMLSIGIIISAVLAFYKEVNLFFIVSCVLYFIVEKVFDEVLRYDLFAKNFKQWSTLSVYRFVIFIISIVPVLIMTSTTSLIICFGINFLGCIVFLHTIHRGFKEVIGFVCQYYLRLIRIGLKSINLVWVFWLLSISSSVFNNYDRLFIYFFSKNEIAYLLIIFMIFSVIQLTVELFFTSLSRNEILNGKFDNMQFLFKRRFLMIVLAGTALSFVVYFLFNKYNDVYNVNADYRVGLSAALSQILLAIIAILREINLWKFSQKRLAWLECINIISLVLIFACLYYFKFPLSLLSFLVVFNIVFLLRINVYAFSIRKAKISLKNFRYDI